jgi:hypothetical protein|tara:strand:+ start:1464 stop:1739 length:276 start_codon:yes stop_codon:yes gene_type:complete
VGIKIKTMIKKIQVKKGILSTNDKNGGVKPVDFICVKDCTDCGPELPCNGEFMQFKDPDNAGEWFRIDMVELAKSLTTPVVKKVNSSGTVL